MGNQEILIDTSLIIDHFRKKNKRKTKFFKLSSLYTFSISAITVFELYVGAQTEESTSYLDELFHSIKVYDLDTVVARRASQIYYDLKRINQLISINDIFIAATAMENKLPLATLNEKHFYRIANIHLILK